MAHDATPDFVFPDDIKPTEGAGKPAEPAPSPAPPTPPQEVPKPPAVKIDPPVVPVAGAEDPAGLPPEARALLDTIAGTESPNYNVMYRGGRFTSYADHPRQDIPILTGPNAGKASSAAGRYQFLASTWDEAKEGAGVSDFSPVSQDKAGWWLAQRDYKDRTGRDLLADLKAGKMEDVNRGLAGTWTSLAGGVEQGTSVAGFAARYAQNLKAPISGVPQLFSDESLAPQFRAGTEAHDPTKYSFLNAASAALKYDTTIGIVANWLAQPKYQPDDHFRWTKDLEREKLADLPAADQTFIKDTAVSASHVDFLRHQVLDRLDADKALASQGFVGSTALMFGAGMGDLPGWLAGGAAGKALLAGRNLGRLGRIGAHAGTFAASAMPLEATKFALDHNYDAGDVARGLAMAALFGGGFGSMGEAGGAIASRFKGFVDNSVAKTSAWEASRAQYAADVGAAVAPPEAPVIEPTWWDRTGARLAKTLDFSVGGRLYHSDNDLISELAPKLTTVATQTLTKGARDIEGALDFKNRLSAMYNMRVENSLHKWFVPYADEQGLSAWSRPKALDDFYEQAQRYHTDPNANPADVNKNVVGFVDDMRKVFADHLDMAKAYGYEPAKNLEQNDNYLPVLFNRVKWRGTREQYGIDGIEDVVAQAIKQGDPEIGTRVGSRIVGRAAERDATGALKGKMVRDPETGQKTLTPNPERQAATDSENAATEAAVKAHKEGAQGELAAVERKHVDDNAGAELDKQDKLAAQKANGESEIDPNSPLSREGIRQSVEEEVQHWKQQEREVRDAAHALPESAKGQRAKLLAEADDLKAFHEGLHAEAEAAWEDAAGRIGKTIEQDMHAARVEADIRRQSVNKEAERESSAIREERDAAIKASREAGENVKAAELAEIKARYWVDAFNKRMAKFEDKFIRRVARKYVETVDNAIEGRRPDIDAALSTRDTKLVREALQRNGIVVDEQLADDIANLIAPRTQRGPAHMRKRTVLDENAAFSPAGYGPDQAFSMRDLMESDYGKIVDRYTRTMAPQYAMAQHGFQSESALRKYIDEVTAQHKGIDGYRDINAFRDRRRANYLADLIYGRDPMPNVDPRWKAAASILSNYSYARTGGSFGMAQTYDAAELVLRHGFEAFRRGVPAMDEIISAIKQGGPHAEGIVRDLQVYMGVGIKGAEAKIRPNFRGLDDQLADDLQGTFLTKAMRVTKGLSNGVAHASGLNILTDVQHVAAARIFLQTIKDVAEGVRKMPSERLMADFGLTPENMNRFGALLKHSSVDGQGIIKDLNTDLLRKIDLKTFDQLMGLTRREAFRTIIEPHAGLMPMIAGNNIIGRFAFQLKSFAATSHAVHTLGNMRLGPAYIATSVIGGAAWATMLYTGWQYWRSVGLSAEERAKRFEKAFGPEMAFNVWNRVGMAGITPEILGTARQIKDKVWRAENDDGTPVDPSNAYGSASRASGLMSGGIASIPVIDMMGALVDSLQTGVDAVRHSRDLTRYEARRAVSLLPLQNASPILQAINAATTAMPVH